MAGIPGPGGRRGGGREQSKGERVGQAADGDGPDRVVLSGPGRAYVQVQCSALPLSSAAAGAAGLVLDTLIGGAIRADMADGDHLLSSAATGGAGGHQATPALPQRHVQ
ncbi:hypothetical protein ACWD6U_34205 [Streptomyces sp. NPDC005149]